MQLSVGTVVEGKVSKITNFGAFINIDGGGSGMVHISEVANTYVKDINEHLKVGDCVKAKVVAINDRISSFLRLCPRNSFKTPGEIKI